MNRTEDAREHLIVEWNELQAAWQGSRAVWKDEVASQFEKRFISPLHAEIPAFLSRLEELRHELENARRELR